MWKNRERQVKGEEQAQKKRLFSCYHWGWGDVEKVWIGAGQPAAEGRCIERVGKVDCNVGERGVPGAGWLPGSLCQRHAARAVPDWPLEWWVTSGSYFIVTFLKSPEHVLFNMILFGKSHSVSLISRAFLRYLPLWAEMKEDIIRGHLKW